MKLGGRQFDRFIFVEYPRVQIEFFRVFFYLFVFAYYFSSNEAMTYTSLDGVYWRPSGLFQFLDFLKPPLDLSGSLSIVWKASLLFCAVGFIAKIFKWVAFVLSIFFLGYTSNFHLYTADSIGVIYFMSIFTLCPFGKSLSIDAWILKRTEGIYDQVPGWTIRFIQLSYVFCWFGSGIQKLRLSGLDWISENHIQFYVIGGSDLFDWSPFIAQAGLGLTLLFELSSPLIFLKRLRYLYLAFFFIFHLASIVFLSLPLAIWLVGFIFWATPIQSPQKKLKALALLFLTPSG